MDPISNLSTSNEISTTSPSPGNEPISFSSGDSCSNVESETVGQPLLKKAKIENRLNDTANEASVCESSSPRELEDTQNADDSNNEGDDDVQQQDRTAPHHLDSEELNLEEDDNSDDDELFQQILALARAGRIPLEYLAARGIHLQLEDDEPVEYPFDHAPKSIEDVANFIKSDKCQRIMVLAG